MKQTYMIPPNLESLLKPLHEALKSESLYSRDVGQAFIRNIEALVSTLGIPFELTFELVHNLHWQRFLIAEQIRCRFSVDVSNAEQLTLSRAKEKFDGFLKSEIGSSVSDEVVKRLCGSIENPKRLASAHELCRQGLVLLWSAFEVLCRDLFVESINRKPTLAERLLNTPVGKKRFMPEKMDWAILSAYGFNISNRLGDILSQRADLDDISTIRDAYLCLAPDNKELANALLSKDLWLLYQRRNLIVHKRAIVDSHYLEKTGDKMEIGTTLLVTAMEMDRLLKTVVTTGAFVIDALSKDD